MVNVTMLVRDRFLLTAQALVSLRETQGTANVTVLDDRSEDKTQNLVDEWCLATGNRSVRNDNPIGTGTARNLVIRASEAMWGRTGYLYLSDNDVLFTSDWLNTLVYCYESAWKHGFRVVGAYNHPYHIPGPGVKVGRMTDQGAKFYEVKEVQALALQSMLMRWCVWDDYGPFRDTPPNAVCQGEDVDFGNAIHDAGFKLGVVTPALLVNCGVTNSFGEKIPGWEMVKAQAPAGVLVE